MAIKEMEGFDLGYRPNNWYDGLSGGLATPSWGTATPGRSGVALSKSAFVNDSSTNRYLVKVLDTSMAEGGVAIALSKGGGVGAGGALIELRESAALTHLWIGQGAGGVVEVRLGSSAGTLLGATVATWSVAGWLPIGVEFKIADAGGYVRLYLGGGSTPVIDVSGVDTKNGGTGVVAQAAFMRQTGAANSMRHDDWYVWDVTGPAPYNAYLGDCRVETLRPNGTGAAADWVGSDGNSVNNWDLIDDDGTTTDYIGSAVTGARDLSTLSDLLAPVSGVVEVHAVQIEAFAAKSDAGPSLELKGVLRDSDGTEAAETLVASTALSTSYTRYRGAIRTVNPDGAAWDYAGVNALQVGVENGA